MQTYPMTVTALKRVTRRKDKNGKPYVSARMMVGAGDKPATERTVRAFGPMAATAVAMLQKGVPVQARVAYDSFSGEDGTRGQTLRIVSLAAAA